MSGGLDLVSRMKVTAALRLGWAVAEARGRNWPFGPRPTFNPLPVHPGHVLPLRSQRPGAASRQESIHSVVVLSAHLQLTGANDMAEAARTAFSPFEQDRPAVEAGLGIQPSNWPDAAAFFLRWDAQFQEELALQGESLANAYLGRWLAECFWGLGPTIPEPSKGNGRPPPCLSSSETSAVFPLQRRAPT